jgi:hypothetical protein
MLKSVAQALVLGAFAVVVGFLAMMLWRTLFHPPQPGNESDNSQAYQTDQERSDEQAFGTRPVPTSAEEAIADYTKWLAILTALLVLVAAFQIAFLVDANRVASESAGAAKRSAKAAFDAVEATRENMRLDQRAWLGIAAIKPVPTIPEVGKPIQAIVEIRNSGKTPARKISINMVGEP